MSNTRFSRSLAAGSGRSTRSTWRRTHHASAPVMYQGGTLDVGITPSIRRAGGVYDASSAPKYFVDLEGAGHLAWTDVRSATHEDIIAYAIAFLDHYVLAAAAAPTLTQALSRVSELRYDSELGHGGTPTTSTAGRARTRP